MLLLYCNVFTYTFGMDYYCFGDDALSATVNIYMNIFYLFFVSICLNDIHYYVLLQWAPALTGISPSGCLHCFFCANKLSLPKQ